MMNPPDWPKCTEEELWRYVAWHLEGAGIRSVLVGGAAAFEELVRSLGRGE